MNLFIPVLLRQIGNAVTPNVAQWLAERVMAVL